VIGGSTVHLRVSSAAVLIFLLVGGVGLGALMIWECIFHGTINSAAVLIFLLVGGVVVKRGSIVHETVRSAALNIFL